MRVKVSIFDFIKNKKKYKNVMLVNVNCSLCSDQEKLTDQKPTWFRKTNLKAKQYHRKNQYQSVDQVQDVENHIENYIFRLVYSTID